MIYPYIPRFDDGYDGVQMPIINTNNILPVNLPSLESPQTADVNDIMSRSLLATSNYRVPEDSYYYTIKRGDTLGDIARRYGMSVSDLQRLNNISNVDLIRQGGRLRLNGAVQNAYHDQYARRHTRRRRSTSAPVQNRQTLSNSNPTRTINGGLLNGVVITRKKNTTPVKTTNRKIATSAKKTRNPSNQYYTVYGTNPITGNGYVSRGRRVTRRRPLLQPLINWLSNL